MSQLTQIADMVGFIDECLAESDWDRLAGLTMPVLPDVALEDPMQIHEALDAVHSMRSRIQQRMDEISTELATVPTVRKASQAYLGRPSS